MKTGAVTRRYTQTARAEAQQRTRDALLDAAGRQFLADRWDRATLEGIAADAGVTKQTLLRHFGSKDGLLDAAAHRGYEQIREERWSAPPGDVEAAVDNLLDHYEAWGEYALRIGGAQGESAALDEVGARARSLHQDWIDHAFGPQLGAFRGRARARRRAALVALCDVNTWRLLREDLGFSRREVRATLVESIRRLVEEQP